jgi:hypothetical protein
VAWLINLGQVEIFKEPDLNELISVALLTKPELVGSFRSVRNGLSRSLIFGRREIRGGRKTFGYRLGHR